MVGVPAVAQWDWWWHLCSTRTQVPSPAQPSGLKDLVLLELQCRSQLWLGSDPLAQELHMPRAQPKKIRYTSNVPLTLWKFVYKNSSELHARLERFYQALSHKLILFTTTTKSDQFHFHYFTNKKKTKSQGDWKIFFFPPHMLPSLHPTANNPSQSCPLQLRSINIQGIHPWMRK